MQTGRPAASLASGLFVGVAIGWFAVASCRLTISRCLKRHRTGFGVITTAMLWPKWASRAADPGRRDGIELSLQGLQRDFQPHGSLPEHHG